MDVDLLRKEVGSKIRKERQARGLTISQLANILELSTSYMGLVERGKRSLSITKLIRFCNLFGVSLDYLLIGGVENLNQCPSKRDDIIAECNGLTEYDLNILLNLIRSYKVSSANKFPYEN